MSKEELIELFDVINEINITMFESFSLSDQNNYDGSMDLSFETNGACSAVKFLGKYIWSSEDDAREYVEANDSGYEPFRGFLLRQMAEMLNALSVVTPVINLLTPKTEDDGTN